MKSCKDLPPLTDGLDELERLDTRLLNYDSNFDESERVKANVYWRIYDLGLLYGEFW